MLRGLCACAVNVWGVKIHVNNAVKRRFQGLEQDRQASNGKAYVNSRETRATHARGGGEPIGKRVSVTLPVSNFFLQQPVNLGKLEPDNAIMRIFLGKLNFVGE